MRICALIHAPFEVPGIFESWAKSRGHSIAEIHTYRGETIPSVNDFDFLLIMGGPQGPDQVSEFPYLKDEIELTTQAISQGKFVVGVCLGAQIIGEALGAPVEKSPHKEVGVFPIQLTSEGQASTLFAGHPTLFPVAHWHNDMPGLTSESLVLATSEGCPRQIVQYTPKALGFQCHLEMTCDMAKGMTINCPDDLAPGTYVQTEEKLLAEDFDTFNTILLSILDRFVDPQQSVKAS